MNLAIVATLPLSTAAQEVAMAVALAVVLWRRRIEPAPWLLPAVALALIWTLSSFASLDLREGIGHAWLLAPLLAVPAFARGQAVERVGIAAALVAAGWAVVQRIGGEPGHAGMSHHLTLAYALLPPLGVAIFRGWWGAVAGLLAGIASTGSLGAVPAAIATLAVARMGRPLVVLPVAALATVLALPLLADPEELTQRAVLWTGGLSLRGVGAGAYPEASAIPYDQLQTGFWFPNHAHDSAIQVLAVLGPAGLVALVWFVGAVLVHAHRAAAAGVVGVLVGGLTQDTLGDLEVARAAFVWLALVGTSNSASGSERA